MNWVKKSQSGKIFPVNIGQPGSACMILDALPCSFRPEKSAVNF